jgi:hypothetical protein
MCNSRPLLVPRQFAAAPKGGPPDPGMLAWPPPSVMICNIYIIHIRLAALPGPPGSHGAARRRSRPLIRSPGESAQPVRIDGFPGMWIDREVWSMPPWFTNCNPFPDIYGGLDVCHDEPGRGQCTGPAGEVDGPGGHHRRRLPRRVAPGTLQESREGGVHEIIHGRHQGQAVLARRGVAAVVVLRRGDQQDAPPVRQGDLEEHLAAPRPRGGAPMAGGDLPGHPGAGGGQKRSSEST